MLNLSAQTFPTLDNVSKSLGYPSFNDLIQKNLRDSLINDGGRHNNMDVFNNLYSSRNKLTFYQRDVLFTDCAFLRLTINKLLMEAFRNGFETHKDFERICKDCGTRYEADIESCDTLDEDGEPCGGETREPTQSHWRRLEKIRKNPINEAKQSLKSIAKQIGLDVEKHDYGVGICKFDYNLDTDKRELLYDSKKRDYIKTFNSFYRGDCSRVRPTLSLIRQTDPREKGQYRIFMVCPIHRHFTKVINEEEIHISHKCGYNKCGYTLEIAEYVLLEREHDNKIAEGYLFGEVIRIVKYEPAKNVGGALIDTLIYPIMILIGQEKINAEYSTDKRNPKGFFIMKMGGNYEQNRRIIEQEMEKYRDDPHYTPWFPVGAEGAIEWIKIDDSPLEMQWEQQREEQRRTIGATIGVSPIFSNDTSTAGGLNNDGLQMVVTNRAVEVAHNTFNEQLWLPLSSAILGVQLDELEYYYEHLPHEEMDQMAEKTRDQMDLTIVQLSQGVGIDVILDEAGNYIKQNPMPGLPLVPIQQQQPGMGMDGMPGGMPGMGSMTPSQPFSGAPQTPAAGASLLGKAMIPIDRIKIPEDYLVTETGIIEGKGLSTTTNYFIENPNDMPPINVIFDKDDNMFVLQDGFHRLNAMKSLGRAMIDADIKKCGDRKELQKARSWDDQTYDEQTKYKKEHPNSTREITAAPTGEVTTEEETEESQSQLTFDRSQFPDVDKVPGKMREKLLGVLEQLQRDMDEELEELGTTEAKAKNLQEWGQLDQYINELLSSEVNGFEFAEAVEKSGLFNAYEYEEIYVTLYLNEAKFWSEYRSEEETGYAKSVTLSEFEGDVLKVSGGMDDEDIYNFFRLVEEGDQYVDTSTPFEELNDDEKSKLKDKLFKYVKDELDVAGIWNEGDAELYADDDTISSHYEFTGDFAKFIDDIIDGDLYMDEIDNERSFFKVVQRMTTVLKHDKIDLTPYINDFQIINDLNTSQRNLIASVAWEMGHYSNVDPLAIYTQPIILEEGQELYHGSNASFLHDILQQGSLGSDKGYAEKYQTQLEGAEDFGGGAFVWSTTNGITAFKYSQMSASEHDSVGIKINMSHEVSNDTKLSPDNDIFGKDSNMTDEHAKEQIFSKSIDAKHIRSISITPKDVYFGGGSDYDDLDVIELDINEVKDIIDLTNNSQVVEQLKSRDIIEPRDKLNELFRIMRDMELYSPDELEEYLIEEND